MMNNYIKNIIVALVMLVPFTGPAITNATNPDQGKSTFVDLKNDVMGDNDAVQKEKPQNDNPKQEDPKQQEDNQKQLTDAEDNQKQDNQIANEPAITEEVEEVSDENTESDTGGSPLIGFIAVILALAAIVFDYILYKKVTVLEKGMKSRSKGSKKTKSEDPVTEDIYARIASLEGNFAILNNAVKRQSGASSNIVQRRTDTRRSDTQNAVRGAIKKYASIVQGNGFPVDFISNNLEPDTIAVLTVNGNNATFIINSDNSVQSKLISNFTYGVARISEVRQKAANPQYIKTVKPGQVVLNGDEWQIVEKAVIDLL